MFPGFRFGDIQLNQPDDIPEVIPVLPLRNTVAFPFGGLPIAVGIPRSVQLVRDAVQGDRLIGLVAMKQPELNEPGPEDVYQVGTLAFIQRAVEVEEGEATLRVLAQGIERFKVEEWLPSGPYLKARVSLAPETVDESLELDALTRSLRNLARQLANSMPQMGDEMVEFLAGIEDRRLLMYLVASNIRMDMETAQELLEIDSLAEKVRRLIGILSHELEVMELGEKIRSEAHEEMTKAQREYFLREQLKAIQRELGEGDEQQTEVEEYRQKIEAAEMPEEAAKEALRELDRLEKMPPQAAEYSVIKTYLDWLTDLPWNEATEDNLNIDHARQVLDEDHYDLEEVKERILEFLAVRKLREERGFDFEDVPATVEEGTGAILCFVGPPGVGKTSLGQSIARALGRKFTRMSLGGLRDEAEIRGHRRTYIGAMPGRVIQAIKRVGTMNPVFMLDEVDKVGTDWRGDPSSALLEVLDPAQNNTFRDHYLDVDFDLSQVLFITTANLLEPISPPLRDRMEIIRLDGYTEYEKVRIAEDYLVRRQVRANGLHQDEVVFTESALRAIIRDYTREAGVRNLEREIGRACRKIAVKIAAGEVEGTVEIDAEQVRELLGKPKHQFEAGDRVEIPGVSTALAVTPTGGDILFVEASRMKGKGNLTLTGQLGDVMKESAQIALSYVRSRAETLDIDPDAFDSTDVHLHVPTGATPKDGPSAGLAMITAVASLLTGRPASAEVGMTGEITLRGQVLPIGGVKQKVLAGHRAGLKRLIVPQRNEPWLEDVPEEVRESIEFVLVDTIEEVLDAALLEESEALERVA